MEDRDRNSLCENHQKLFNYFFVGGCLQCWLEDNTETPTFNEEGLLPCPFCKNYPVYITDFEDEKKVVTVHHVSCGFCYVQPGVYGQTSKEEAFNKWNDRTEKSME